MKSQSKDRRFVAPSDCLLLDFLLASLTDKSRNNVKSILKHGEVFIGGIPVTRHDTPVRAGQEVLVKSRSARASEGAQDVLNILFEDEDIIVFEKPQGLLTIASDKEKERTAYHMLTDYVKASDPAARVFIVHRLDRDTSGLLVIAKNEHAKENLQSGWDKPSVRKSYAAVVEGIPNPSQGTARSYLKENSVHVMYSSSRQDDGHLAITDYAAIRAGRDYALMEIELRTGRKNQIRVHMKDIGHSIAGDKKYGAQSNPIKRMALHAAKLSFPHPRTGRAMSFESEIPKSFYSLVRG